MAWAIVPAGAAGFGAVGKYRYKTHPTEVWVDQLGNQGSVHWAGLHVQSCESSFSMGVCFGEDWSLSLSRRVERLHGSTTTR